MRAASALIARGLRAAAGDVSDAAVEPPLAAAPPAAQARASSGVVERSELHYAAARKWQQAEDRFLLEPACEWHPAACEGGKATATVPFSLFAVFDGHGGKAAAEACVARMLPELLAALARAPPPPAGACGTAALNAALPAALVAAFLAVDVVACAQPGRGGTTATVAVVVGRTATVAAAGDSLAVLDAGAAVAKVSAEHRLESHGGERERVLAAGATVAPSTVDGDKPAGPLRVWPGGLAVSRSIGDADGKPAVTASPEVSQFAIPRGAGARLMLASDGLWDAAAPKAAAHAARAHPGAAAAATALLRVAAQKRSHRDDVTVVVLDFLASSQAKGPFGDTGLGAQPVPGTQPVPVKWPVTGVAAAPSAGYAPPDEAPRAPKRMMQAQQPAPAAAAEEEEARWAAELAAVVIASEKAEAEASDTWTAVPTKRKAAAMPAPPTPPKAPPPPPVVAPEPMRASAAAAAARKALNKPPPRPRTGVANGGADAAASDAPVAAEAAAEAARAAAREAKKVARRDAEREARRSAAAARAASARALEGTGAPAVAPPPAAATPALPAADAPAPAPRRPKATPKPRREAPATASGAHPEPLQQQHAPVPRAPPPPAPAVAPVIPPPAQPQGVPPAIYYYATHSPAPAGLQFGSFPPPPPPPPPAAAPPIQFGSFAPAQAGPPPPPPPYGGNWGGYAPHQPPRTLPAPRVHRLEDVEAALRSGAMR